MPIHSNFDSIIGQTRAKTLLSAGIDAAKAGRPITSPLIQGAPGLGKTEIMHRYLDGLEANGFRVLRFSSPRDIRLPGSGWEYFMETVMDYTTPYAIGFDECHEMAIDKVKNMRSLFTFIRKAMDRTNHNRDIVVSEEFSTRFDRTKNVICMATNYVNTLDPSKALISRFDNIELDLYNYAELRRILAVMMADLQMEVDHEDVLQIIANCGRGTARPMRNIVEQINTVFGTGSPITMEQTFEILRLTKMFPKGLAEYEVELLLNARTRCLKDSQFLAITPSVEPSQLRASKGYLTSHQIGFLTQTPSGMETTTKGKRYLQRIAELGFIDASRLEFDC